MNQLVSQQAGGALVFKGTVSEPATVTVGGKPATVTGDNHFEGAAMVPGGTGQVAVTATDPSGNVRTSTYQVTQGATSKTFTYDANGNMTSDGTRAYEWDAENRLVAVKEGANTVASFTYNRGGIRASKTAAGVTTSYVVERASVLEERSTSGGVTRHFEGLGIDDVVAMQDATGVVTYLTRDHLGSVREHVAAGGAIVLRRDYDPWGRLLAGGTTSGAAFTGRENEPETGLHYYRARYYLADLGRFLSLDPAGLSDGPHGYAYVRNRPTLRRDPSGKYTIAPSAQKYQDLIDDAMEQLRTTLVRQPKQCCLGWFGKQGADPIPWAVPGAPPEVRAQDLPGSQGGYTQAPFEFLVLDIDILKPGIDENCAIASAILHEFGHFAGKQPRKKGEKHSDFVKACTYGCLAPEGVDDLQ